MMMMMPSIFKENLLDDFFTDPFGSFGSPVSADQGSLMKTDVKDLENGYELTVNLPGAKKEDIKAELKDGYLTIKATTEKKEDEKDKEGHYIRRERYYGAASRSFYVGNHVKEEDIKAKYENGVLTLDIPKKNAEQIEAEKKYIAIEG